MTDYDEDGLEASGVQGWLGYLAGRQGLMMEPDGGLER